MNLKINGKEKTVEGSALTVSELLKLENVDMPEMVSVELNGEILDRDQFGSQSVKDGDALEFLYFMGGGSFHSIA